MAGDIQGHYMFEITVTSNNLVSKIPSMNSLLE